MALLAGGVLILSSALVATPAGASSVAVGGIQPQMILCGYGNCQPTTWTREVQVQIFAPTPSGSETVWVKEVVNGVLTKSGFEAEQCVLGMAGTVIITAVVGGPESVFTLGSQEYAMGCAASALVSTLAKLVWNW